MTVKLAFGTAGIRALVGEGDDKLNLGTVRAVAHALVSYVLEVVPDAAQRGMALGYDGRTTSQDFARAFAGVAESLGMQVRAFDRPVPTPLVAFAARWHRCALGVVITASHNPASDNGIKVYWEGGAQIRAPHDAAVAARIQSGDPRPLGVMAGRVRALGDDEIEAYLAAVDAIVPAASRGALPRIAYTALCGVGSELVNRLLSRLGVSDFVEVEAQARPQGDFGGLASPNPEDPRAMAQVLALAEQQQAGLILANDPDADRLAVAIRTRTGTLRVLSGDEVGALLGSAMLDLHGTQAVLVSTVVSSGLLEAIARARGARFERTLTGFKHITQRGRAVEQSEHVPFLFGYEEAIGYGFGMIADDKDGLAAMRVLIELTRRLTAHEKTLEDALDDFARAHGLFETRQVTVKALPEAMQALVASVRALPATDLLGEGASVVDYLAREERADLLVFSDAEGTRVRIRPSGTEPKLKAYLEARVDVEQGEDIDAARARARSRLDQLVTRLAAHGVG